MTNAGTQLEAGPIAMSKELVELLRLRRALSDALPGRREELEPQGRDVALSFVADVEASLGVLLPFDIVALSALRIPLFQRAVGLSLQQLSGVIRDCAGDFGAPRGWVAVASFGGGAMRDDVLLEQAGYDTLLAVSRKSRSRAGDPEVRIVDGEGPSRVVKLASFVRERVAIRYNRSATWARAIERARNDTRPIEEECTARLVEDRPIAASGPERVVHPKFGTGTVVRHVEGDKLEIAFDAGGMKTLLRKFVSPQ